MTSTGPFREVHHVCIVVHDLEAASAFLEGLGVGPWRDYPPMTDYVEREVGDDEAFMALRYRIADVRGCQIQLVEPGPGDTPQRARLNAVGPSVFSIGFATEDIATTEDEALALGRTPILRGRRADGSGFTYFDTFDEVGFSMLLRQSPPPV